MKNFLLLILATSAHVLAASDSTVSHQQEPKNGMTSPIMMFEEQGPVSHSHESNNQDERRSTTSNDRDIAEESIVTRDGNQNALTKTAPLHPNLQDFYKIGWEIFLKNSLEKAEATLKQIHINNVAAAYYANHSTNNPNTPWNQVRSNAERVVQYIKNCIADHNNNCLSPRGLAAIDRAEEALRLRLKAARFQFDRDYTKKADFMEDMSKYMVNALLAERGKNQALLKGWTRAISRSSPEIQATVRSSKHEFNHYEKDSSPSPAMTAASVLAKASNYSMTAAKARAMNYQEVAYHCDQAAEQARLVALYSILIGQTDESNEFKKRSHLYTLLFSSKSAFDNLYKTASHAQNLLDAISAGDQNLIHFWTWTLRFQQIANDHEILINQAKGKKNEKTNKLINVAFSCATSLAEAGKKALNLSTQAIDFGVKANEARAHQNDQEANLWSRSQQEMQTASQVAIKIGLEKMITEPHQSIFLQTLTTKIENIAGELSSLAQQTKTKNFVSYHEKAQEASSQGHLELANLWTKIRNEAKKFQATDEEASCDYDIHKLKTDATLAEADAIGLERSAEAITKNFFSEPKFENKKIVAARNAGDWKEVQRLETAIALDYLTARLADKRSASSSSPSMTIIDQLAELNVIKSKALAIENEKLIALVEKTEELDQTIKSQFLEKMFPYEWEYAVSHRMGAVKYYINQALEASMADHQEQADLWMQAAEKMTITVEKLLEASSIAAFMEKRVKITRANEIAQRENQIPSLQYLAWKEVSQSQKKLIQFAEALTLRTAKSAEYDANFKRAVTSKNQETIDLCSLALSQQQLAVAKTLQAIEVYLTGNKTESQRLNNEASVDEAVAHDNATRSIFFPHYVAQADKNRITGNQLAADAWHLASQQVKKPRSNLTSWADKNLAQKAADLAGSFYAEAGEYRLKASAAKAANHQEISDLWTKAAEQMSSARSHSNQHVLLTISQALAEAANYATKAIACTAAKNPEEAYLYDQAAKQLEKAVTTTYSAARWVSEKFVKAIQYRNHAAEAMALEKENAAAQWIQAANQIKLAAECTAKITQPQTTITPSINHFDTQPQKRAQIADDSLLNSFYTEAGRAAEAASKKRVEIAGCYEEGIDKIDNAEILAQQNQMRAERFIKAAHSKIAGNQAASELWAQAANQQDFFQSKDNFLHGLHDFNHQVPNSLTIEIAAALAQEAEARDAGEQNKVEIFGEDSAFVKDIITRFLNGIEYKERAVACRAAGKEKEAELWNKAGSASQADAKYRASNANQDAMQHVIDLDLNNNPWSLSTDRYIRAAENLAADRIELASLLEQAATISESTSSLFFNAAEALEEGNKSLSDLWTKAAEQNKIASTPKPNPYRPATLSQNPQSQRWDSFSNAADTLAKKSSDQFVNAAEALASGNQQFSDLWIRAAEQTQLASEKRRAQAQTQDKTKDAKLKKAAITAEQEAERLAKLAMAQTTSKK